VTCSFAYRDHPRAQQGGHHGRRHSQEGDRRVIEFLILLGLAGVLAGFVVTALVRAKKLGDRWESMGLWAIFGGFGLVMVAVALAIGTVE
jgi:hypothetical protein